jgi:hypothetical protein
MAFDEASLVPIAAPQRALGQACAACRPTAALVALALLVSPARAAELPAPGLNWVRLSGAESCISAAALAQRVETRVGRALFVAIAEAALFVDGHVSPSAVEGWQVTLELSEPGGKVLGRREMQFAGSDCSAIDEAVALVIAVTLYPNTSLVGSGIALDPSTSASLQALFGAEPVDPDPSSLPASAPATASTSTTARATSAAEHAQQRSDRVEPEPDSSSPATRAQGWRVAVDAAAAAGLGHLPGASLGVAAHVAITPPSAWPIEAGFVLFPPKTAQMDGTSGRVRFDSLAASLILCPWQPAWLAELALCAGAEVGRLRARSDGFPEGDTTANDAIANALGAARLRFQLVGALELHARLVLAVPLAQHRYTVQTDDGATATLFRIPQLAARSELGLALAF